MNAYRTALVTGATSGIGRAITTQLSDMGLQVFALGRNQSVLEELATAKSITPIAVDVTDRAGVRNALNHLDIDVFINNSGIMPPPKPFQESSPEDIDQTLEVNINAAFALTQMLLPAMVQRRRGHIFFTGSTAGHSPFPNMAVYGASKAAIASLAASLRCDLAGTNVRITEIVAGRVQTALYEPALGKEAARNMYKTGAPIAPHEVALMVQTVLEMPAHVDVSRFDILPTAQFVGGGGMVEDKQ